MTKPRYGVEPLSIDDVKVEPPFCPHGPTLVFERYYADREPRKFFACALHRDRKGCSFFQWVDEPISPDKRERWMKSYRETNPRLDRTAMSSSLESLRSLSESKRVFCHSCSRLIPLSSVSPEHVTHELRYSIEDTLLTQPSQLLIPVDDKKSSAQYFFSERCCQLLLSELKRLKVTGVLCVGTPRLHESILSQLAPKVHSLLLDVDSRYAQFYPPSVYQHYNMFNGHFYEEGAAVGEEERREVGGEEGREVGGEEVCREFLHSRVVAIVIDPPFGGLVEVLARQVRRLWNMAGEEVSTVLVFPYFMEQHVSSALSSLKMCDYQVTYDNHKHFSSSWKSTKPSPVRLFTNFPPPGPCLPRSEGYQFCRLCQRYVAPNNTHCNFCGSCTSKDGRKYCHCRDCGVCVKPAREHCANCGTCQLPNHVCGDRVAIGCHICGSLDHKRRDCPSRAETLPVAGGDRKGKRKRGHSSGASRAKRRTRIVPVVDT